jgi:ankyrin repeat protein
MRGLRQRPTDDGKLLSFIDHDNFRDFEICLAGARLDVFGHVECCARALFKENFLSLLLNYGDVDNQSHCLLVAIDRSTNERYEDLASVMIDRLPHVAERPFRETSPLHTAARNINDRILNTLIKRFESDRAALMRGLNSEADPQGTPLHIALQSNNIGAVKSLADAHSLVHQIPSSRVLDIPIKRGNTDSLETVLNVFPELLDSHALDLIIRVGSMETWDLAISRRPELLRDSHALHRAVEEQKLKIVQAILGTNPELVVKKDDSGQFPLQYNRPKKTDVDDDHKCCEHIRQSLLLEIMRQCTAEEVKNMFQNAESMCLQPSSQLYTIQVN